MVGVIGGVDWEAYRVFVGGGGGCEEGLFAVGEEDSGV